MTEIQVNQKSSNKLNYRLLILILNWNVVGSYFGLVWATGPQARYVGPLPASSGPKRPNWAGIEVGDLGTGSGPSPPNYKKNKINIYIFCQLVPPKKNFGP